MNINDFNFQYTINPESDNPIMLINDTIGYDGFEGINGGDFQKELLILDEMNKESIEIWINSGGGSVLDGFSICSAIINVKTKIITNNVGIAGSIAGVIFMCGKERIMSDYALLMMHNVSGGNEKAREELNNSISLLLSKNASLSQDQVKLLMNNETWMNYEETKSNGFLTNKQKNNFQNNDSVVFMENENTFENVFEYANKIINMAKTKDIEKPVNELEIQPDENLVIGEVESDSTTDKKPEVEIEGEKAELGSGLDAVIVQHTHSPVVQELENKLDLTNSLKDYVNVIAEKDLRIKELENELATLKAEEVEKEILNFVNQSVEVGKISNESKDTWINLCKSDFENTKEVIKGLNINKQAPVLQNNSPKENKTPKTFAEMLSFGKNKK